MREKEREREREREWEKERKERERERPNTESMNKSIFCIVFQKDVNLQNFMLYY